MMISFSETWSVCCVRKICVTNTAHSVPKWVF
ncbi:hypothetical protein TSAR_013900 [Trichomalopsis sarcophagae]|uniref:Uncharacterized protein n=1 Tax=Trichomalopsis sarcophagae TaxID=543379 RepID=A0A232ED49_9HYME|nr:hypothetical protein TSAR_013900 [Trichomalopsis sarcophagae]